MRKRIGIILLILAMVLVTGCDKSKDKNTSESVVPDENSIFIYYPENKCVLAYDETFQLKQPDLLVQSVEEVMTAWTEILGSEIIQYDTYMIDGNNDVELDFSLVGDSENREYFLLARAAVTQTLFQLKDINCISIKLTDREGNVVYDEKFDRHSFYFYGYQ